MVEGPAKIDHTLFYRVIYGDTDKAGVVYYGTYMRLFEIGRTELLRERMGLPYSHLEERGIIFPVVELNCRYKAPARYDDLLEIWTCIQGCSKVSITFRYEIRRDGKLLVHGSTKHASVDLDGHLARLPQELIQVIGSC